MQFAFAATERIAPDQQDARFQDERKKAFDGFTFAAHHATLTFNL